MTLHEDQDRVRRLTGELDLRVRTCAGIARELQSAGEPVWKLGFFDSLLGGSDFEKYEYKLRTELRETLSAINRLRSKHPSPELINTGAVVREVLSCCDQCSIRNIKRGVSNRNVPFDCEVLSKDQPDDTQATQHVRFTLNGQEIIDHDPA